MVAGSLWTPTQQKVIAIIPKFSAGLSFLGSSCIICEVLFFDRRKLGRVYHRLLLAMSLYDVLESSFNFASTWPIPKGTEGVAFASGTQQTCTLQGFILQFGLAIPVLNMCLSIYYLLVIKYSWSEKRIRKRVEPWFHGVALVMALSFCFASLAMDHYNNANLWCWIAPLPLDCLDSFRYGDEGNCIRGDNAWIYRWAFYYAELWFCILFVMFAMIAVYLEVRRLERNNLKYKKYEMTSPNNGEGDRERMKMSKSRRVAHQALCYVGAFYATFVWATVNRLVQQIAKETYFAITVLHTIFEPGQGFMNYCVYIRPRYLSYREKNPTVSRWMALRRVIFPDDDAQKARKESQYVDEDHEDEELARKELKRWRLGSFRRKSQRNSQQESRRQMSGVFRLMTDDLDGDDDDDDNDEDVDLDDSISPMQRTENVASLDDPSSRGNTGGEEQAVQGLTVVGGEKELVNQNRGKTVSFATALEERIDASESAESQ